MHALYFQKRRERNRMVYILAAYMETVVCASFALICLCLGDLGCIDGFLNVN